MAKFIVTLVPGEDGLIVAGCPFFTGMRLSGQKQGRSLEKH